MSHNTILVNSQSADRLSAIVATDATKLAIASNLSDIDSAGTARTNLGLVIGTDVAPIAAPAFTGNATAVTQSQSDGSTKIATTAYVDTAVSGATGGSAPDVKTAAPSGAYSITTHAGVEEIYLLTPSANVAVNLPACSTCGAGFKYQIKNLSTSYTLTLTPASETIDTSASYVISNQYESVTLVTDGSNWFVI